MVHQNNKQTLTTGLICLRYLPNLLLPKTKFRKQRQQDRLGYIVLFVTRGPRLRRVEKLLRDGGGGGGCHSFLRNSIGSRTSISGSSNSSGIGGNTTTTRKSLPRKIGWRGGVECMMSVVGCLGG